MESDPKFEQKKGQDRGDEKDFQSKKESDPKKDYEKGREK